MYRLHIIPAQGGPFDQPLVGDSLVVGRATDVDIVLNDPFLSRRHARLYRSGESWWVEDLGSANGTIVNHQRIGGATELRSGDQIQVSGCSLHFRSDAATDEASAEPEADAADSASDAEAPRPEQHTVFLKAADLLPRLAEGKPSDTKASAPGGAPTEAIGSLEQTEERLALVMEIHQALSRSIEQDELLELILERAFDHLSPEEGVIFLSDADGGYYRAARKALPDISSEYAYTSLLAEVADKGLAACVVDVEQDERFAGADSIQASGIRSLVAAPLFDEDGSLGMIALSSRLQKRLFNQSDTELLVCLASVAALQIRNATLAEHAAERQRMEHELQLARDIQERLLPEQLPDLGGYAMYATNLPSRGVSGDYYNVVERRDGDECLVLIADVCGKGMAASLLTASVDALTVGPIEDNLPVDEFCGTVARRLYSRTPITKYATAIVGALAVESGAFEYVNAGHNPGLLIHPDGSVETLEPAGMPIGVVPEVGYSTATVSITPGDLLVLYTDGLTEALDPEDEEYGEESLTRVCVDHRDAALDELAQAIDEDISAFVRGVPYRDDRTLILVRREP